MLDTWIAPQKRDPCQHKFPVTDVSEIHGANEETLDYLADQALLAHTDPQNLQLEFADLLDDSKELGLDVIASYIESNILPSKIATRICDFGEMLAAQFLVEFEAFWLPIYKLRYREKRDWAMRLTDLCLIKRDGLRRPLLCFGEVKTKSSGCDKRLGLVGHSSLKKDDALDNPEILLYVCMRLYDQNRLDDAAFVHGIRTGQLKYDRRHDLFLVHERANWSEDILSNLDACELDAKLVDFNVKVILISDLRALIDSTYSRVPSVAQRRISGQTRVS